MEKIRVVRPEVHVEGGTQQNRTEQNRKGCPLPSSWTQARLACLRLCRPLLCPHRITIESLLLLLLFFTEGGDKGDASPGAAGGGGGDGAAAAVADGLPTTRDRGSSAA